jgi:hypothetical protein
MSSDLLSRYRRLLRQLVNRSLRKLEIERKLIDSENGISRDLRLRAFPHVSDLR